MVFSVSFSSHRNAQRQAESWIQEIREKFPNSAESTLRTVFLEVEDQRERSFQRNLEDLWEEISALEEFECKDMQAVLAENDQLEKEKRNAEAEKKRAQEVFRAKPGSLLTKKRSWRRSLKKKKGLLKRR